jgi:hypothetical protein
VTLVELVLFFMVRGYHIVLSVYLDEILICHGELTLVNQRFSAEG